MPDDILASVVQIHGGLVMPDRALEWHGPGNQAVARGKPVEAARER